MYIYTYTFDRNARATALTIARASEKKCRLILERERFFSPFIRPRLHARYAHCRARARRRQRREEEETPSKGRRARARAAVHRASVHAERSLSKSAYFRNARKQRRHARAIVRVCKCAVESTCERGIYDSTFFFF